MAGKVNVNSVDSLSTYCQGLSVLKTDLESMAAKLVFLSEELQQKAVIMRSSTDLQASNWYDPQYEKLLGEITPCVIAVNSMSTSVKEAAVTLQKQMVEVETSISYIQNLVKELRNLS